MSNNYDVDPAQYAPPEVYQDTGYGSDPAQYAPPALEAPEAPEITSAQADPEFARRLAERARPKRPDVPEEPLTRESGLVPLLGGGARKLAERGLESVGEAGRAVAGGVSDVADAVADRYGGMKQALADYVNGTIAPPAAEVERQVQAAPGATPGEKALNAVLDPAPAAAAELPAAARTTGYAAAGELSPDYLEAAGGQALAGQAPAGAPAPAPGSRYGTYIGPQGEERTGPNTAVAKPPADRYALTTGDWRTAPTPQGLARAESPGSMIDVPTDLHSPLTPQELENAKSRTVNQSLLNDPVLRKYLPPGYLDSPQGVAALERLNRASDMKFPNTESGSRQMAEELLSISHPQPAGSNVLPRTWQQPGAPRGELNAEEAAARGYPIPRGTSVGPSGVPGNIPVNPEDSLRTDPRDLEGGPYGLISQSGGGGRGGRGGSRGSSEAAGSRGSGGGRGGGGRGGGGRGGGGRGGGRRSELDQEQMPAGDATAAILTGYNAAANGRGGGGGGGRYDGMVTGYNAAANAPAGARYAAADTGTMTDAGPEQPARAAPGYGSFTPGQAGGASNTILPTRPGGMQSAPPAAVAPKPTPVEDPREANRQEYFRRLRAGEPTGIDAGYGRGVDTTGTYDFSRPLPPRQAPTTQSMADRDEAIRQNIIRADTSQGRDPVADLLDRAAQSRDPNAQRMFTNEAYKIQESRRINQQKSADAALKTFTTGDQNLIRSIYTKENAGNKLTPDEQNLRDEHVRRTLERQRGQQGGQPGVAAAGQQAVRVGSPEEARRLPKGTRIILPDGSPGVVP